MAKFKKQKQKNTDFQKVKFKVGKKLPKAANVTSTAFKSKGIVLKQQLKDTGYDDPKFLKAARKPRELLAHLQHVNSAFRLAALQALKEVMVVSPGALSLHFGPMIERVAALVSDREKEVRTAALDCLKSLISAIGGDGILAYGSTIVAYLRCSMTHLDNSVQLDSIRFLDLVFTSCRQILLTDLNLVLLNFLDLVSTSPTPGYRTLKISPTNKLTSIRWRTEVLRNVKSLFDLYHSSQAPPPPPKCDKSSVEYNDERQSLTVVYHPAFYALKGHLNPQFEMRSELNCAVNLVHPLIDVIKELIPLLNESWVECAKGSSALNGDTAKNLLTIVSIVRVGSKILASDASNHAEIQKSMTNLVEQFFRSGFPFTAKHPNIRAKTCPIAELNLRFCVLSNELRLQGPPDRLTNNYIQDLVGQGTVDSSLELDVILKYLADKNKDNEALEFLNELLQNILTNSHVASMKSFITTRLASYSLKDDKLRSSYMELLIALLHSKAGPHLLEPLIEDILSYLNKTTYRLSIPQYLHFLELCRKNPSLVHRYLMLLPYVDGLLTSRELLTELRAVCWQSSSSSINLILHTLLSNMSQDTAGSVLSFLCSSLLGFSAAHVVCSDWSALQRIAVCVAQLSRTFMKSQDLYCCLENFINRLGQDIGFNGILSILRLVQSSSLKFSFDTEGFSQHFIERLTVKALIEVLARKAHTEYVDNVMEVLQLNMTSTIELLMILVKECKKDAEFKDLISILYHLRSTHTENIDWSAVKRTLTGNKMLKREISLHKNMCKLLAISMK